MEKVVRWVKLPSQLPDKSSDEVYLQTRMWANAQRDGRRAEHRCALCAMPQSLVV